MKAGVRPCMTWCFPTFSLYRSSLYRFLHCAPRCTMQTEERSERARCIARKDQRVEPRCRHNRKNRATCHKNPSTRRQIAHALRKEPPCICQLRPCNCQLRPRKRQLRPCKRQLRPCKCQLRPRNHELRPRNRPLLTSSCEMRPRNDAWLVAFTPLSHPARSWIVGHD
jgi:hypothetical protein